MLKIIKFDVEHNATSSIHWFNVKKPSGAWRVRGVRVKVYCGTTWVHDTELLNGGYASVVEPKILRELNQRLGDRTC